jgi:hypothetical protein
MIASDATAQRAPPCHLDHPQLQPAGRAVRLGRKERSPTRTCVHSAIDDPVLNNFLGDAGQRLALQGEGQDVDFR